MLEKDLWKIFIGRNSKAIPVKDLYDRELFSDSVDFSPCAPKVSEYLLENGLNPIYPDNKNFALCISHDIDTLGTRNHKLKSFFELNGSLKNKVNEGIKLIKNIFNQEKNGIKTGLSKLHEINKKYNAHSSFYFLALHKGELDYNYSIKDLKAVLNETISNHGEIGLHGGFNAYMDQSKLKQEKDLLESSLGKKVIGYRGHYLKFKAPETWQLLENLNFEYDTTYAFPNHIGFRNGMCHPFRPYDEKQGKFLNILELPLAIMDTTLTKYMGLSLEDQFTKCKQLIDIANKNKGVLSLLWHNDNMHGEGLELYEKVLNYAYEKKAWMPTGKEMVNHWKSKKYDEIQLDILMKIKGNG